MKKKSNNKTYAKPRSFPKSYLKPSSIQPHLFYSGYGVTLDLTVLFGKGNEPTVEQVDGLLTRGGKG